MFNNKTQRAVLTAIALASIVFIMVSQGPAEDNDSPTVQLASAAQAADTDSDASPAYAYSAPADLGASCPITKDEFKDWFLDHEITKDGIVTPADSLKRLKTSCDFYAWSWRMFLWLMSNPNDGLVFNTAPFFDLNEDNELVSGAPKKHHVRGGKREGTDRTGRSGTWRIDVSGR